MLFKFLIASYQSSGFLPEISKTINFVNGIQDYLNDRAYFIKECNYNDLESYKDGLDWLYNNLNI